MCRPYVKGRDWFDFVWYVNKEIVPNFAFLKNALEQTGPWQQQSLKVNKQWLSEALIKKIKKIDWQIAKQEVQHFISTEFAPSLNVWSTDFFIEKARRLINQLN